MEINPDVLKILDHYKIPRGEALTYLISLWYGYRASYIPQELMATVGRLDIYKRRESDMKLFWTMPLFIVKKTVEEKRTEAFKAEMAELGSTPTPEPMPFDDSFIEKYRKIFKDKNTLKSCSIKEIKPRMKKLLADPDITPEIVLGATKMYVNNTGRTYIMLPHYFIEKGVGSAKTQTILGWIERYNEFKKRDESESITRKMQ